MISTGVNSFTGPNARLSAYFICNFGGVNALVGVVVCCWYLLSVRLVIKSATMVPSFGIVVPSFLLYSIVNSAHDFNLIMQDMLYFPLMSSCFLLLYAAKQKT
jgi:hypothetical protein